MSDKKGLFHFVIHKHDATRLHYDFRLEIAGTMPSWAIPKGPSLDSTVKRLAMRTPNHSMDYRNFEGVLEEGSYGAGPVMIWDEGMYTPEVEIEKGVRKLITDKKEAEKVMQEELKKGQLKFTLYGKKLRGSFALVKTKGFGDPKKDSWLLIKHKDEFVQPNYDANTYDISARSDRTLKEISNS
jgi:bifunctional non-homologous end joining protein LigD